MPFYVPPIIANGAISLVGAAFVVSAIISVLKLFLEPKILKPSNPWHNPIFWSLPFIFSFIIMIGGSILIGAWAGHQSTIISEAFTAGGLAIFGYKLTNGGKAQSPFGPLVSVTSTQLAAYETDPTLTNVLNMMVEVGVIQVTTGPVNPANPVKTELKKVIPPVDHTRSLQ